MKRVEGKKVSLFDQFLKEMSGHWGTICRHILLSHGLGLRIVIVISGLLPRYVRLGDVRHFFYAELNHVKAEPGSRSPCQAECRLFGRTSQGRRPANHSPQAKSRLPAVFISPMS